MFQKDIIYCFLNLILYLYNQERLYIDFQSLQLIFPFHFNDYSNILSLNFIKGFHLFIDHLFNCHHFEIHQSYGLMFHIQIHL